MKCNHCGGLQLTEIPHSRETCILEARRQEAEAMLGRRPPLPTVKEIADALWADLPHRPLSYNDWVAYVLKQLIKVFATIDEPQEGE